jgi:peptidoglycan/xylan/chitin deacetylase (PgdA/CDA1 family)
MLRGDALATLYFFHPLQRLAQSRKVRVPILMYHRISDCDESTIHPYYRTATAPAVFAQHMRFLHENNYVSVSLSEAAAGIVASNPDNNGRPIVITFDDGYEDFYTHAFPILSQCGFSATVFLPTAFIGDTNRRFKNAQCLTWNQVRKLQVAGVHFGSHTVTHPKLQTLAQKDIEDELRHSKEKIEEELGSPVRSFAYPYAFPETNDVFKQRLRELLNEAGYENGVSTIVGTADRRSDKFFMKRLPMNSCDDLRLFKAKLDGHYNWVHMAQYAWKVLYSQWTTLLK